ncbi:hypothetical protein, partial [Akkermansia sp.]|uniref:hypothetical protein n=1 Tax=Akkermansia sp. TaxID=1872421 RepID=UPI003AEFFD29
AAGAAIGAAVQHDRDKDRYRNDWHHHNPPPPMGAVRESPWPANPAALQLCGKSAAQRGISGVR